MLSDGSTSARELFTRHNLRCTSQRLALYETLRKSTCHPTAEELFRMVLSETRGLSRATVYNALEAFCKAGLVRQLPTANGCCRYDADMSEHLHLRIRETSEIRDVPADLGSQLLGNLPQDVLTKIETHMGVKIDGVTIQLLGRQKIS
jgi:Fe2+ or Zn2+ uptake regulation protein